MDDLIRQSHLLVDGVPLGFMRSAIHEIDWGQRLVGITGPRGIGKSTMLRQYIKSNYGLSSKAAYLSLDNIHFLNNKLMGFVEDFHLNGGRHLFLDEVHRYPPWSVEVKNIYDNWPDLRMVFTGSSALEIFKGQGDLSRRATMYRMGSLSLREYIGMSRGVEMSPISLDDILTHHVDIANELRKNFECIPLFKEYLLGGSYPFFIESKTKFHERLLATLHVVLEMDIPAIERISYSTVISMKRVLSLISEAAPFKPNIAELARKSGLARDVLLRLIDLLGRSDILMTFRQGSSPTGYLTKPEKIYLHNTALSYALAEQAQPSTGTLRETFFANQVSSKHSLTIPKHGDFQVDGEYLFEIGGRNKNSNQIKDSASSWVAMDDIEIGSGQKVPLWLFGFLY